jgi:pectate lyase
VLVAGKLDANTDASGRHLSCADYARQGYTLQKYLDAYAPEVWGRDSEPSGPVEDARAASQQAQAERVTIRVGSNTTLVGRPGARITGANLRVDAATNVIIRGLTLTDAYDCFPAWDPTDGDTGNWNSEYDSAVIYGSTHVWLDHNTFTDGDHPDSSLPTYFGRIFEQHDGELDIVKGADYVTASWNVFGDHDKTILIGNSDSASTAAVDRGHLKVTLHHNLFSNLIERAPRVRFGQVDSYNNHFVAEPGYGYSYGIGLESQLVAEHNAFTVPAGISEATVLIAVHNAGVPTEILQSGAGWTPTLRTKIDPAKAVPFIVDRGAGAGRLR